MAGYGEVQRPYAESDEEDEPLTEEQIAYIENLLDEEEIAEEDAELVLTLIGERAEDAVEQMLGIFERFPALARSVHAVAGCIKDKEELCSGLTRIATKRRALAEDQLFWAAKIAEDHLGGAGGALKLLTTLESHPAATVLTRAKILEIPRADLDDVRVEYLKGGRSDWLAWSSAVGTRRVAKSKRNHLLQYYRKGSPMNEIVGGCVKQL